MLVRKIAPVYYDTANAELVRTDGRAAYVRVGSGGGVVSAKVNVTSAEMLALYDTPKILIAAPGAGKMLTVLKVVFKYNVVSTPYNTTNLTLGYTNGVLSGNQVAYTLSSTSQYSITVRPNDFINTDVDNYGFQMSSLAALTGGNGTMSIYVTYLITDL